MPGRAIARTLLAVMVAFSASAASADVFNMPLGRKSLQFVPGSVLSQRCFGCRTRVRTVGNRLNGTYLVKDILPGIGSSNPHQLVDAEGPLFFLADDGVHGVDPWASDGSENGTRLVRDVFADSVNYTVRLTAVGNKVFFASAPDLWLEPAPKPDSSSDPVVILSRRDTALLFD